MIRLALGKCNELTLVAATRHRRAAHLAFQQILRDLLSVIFSEYLFRANQYLKERLTCGTPTSLPCVPIGVARLVTCIGLALTL